MCNSDTFCYWLVFSFIIRKKSVHNIWVICVIIVYTYKRFTVSLKFVQKLLNKLRLTLYIFGNFFEHFCLIELIMDKHCLLDWHFNLQVQVLNKLRVNSYLIQWNRVNVFSHPILIEIEYGTSSECKIYFL